MMMKKVLYLYHISICGVNYEVHFLEPKNKKMKSTQIRSCTGTPSSWKFEVQQDVGVAGQIAIFAYGSDD